MEADCDASQQMPQRASSVVNEPSVRFCPVVISLRALKDRDGAGEMV